MADTSSTQKTSKEALREERFQKDLLMRKEEEEKEDLKKRHTDDWSIL
jgi:hypothetical protein